MCSSSRTRSTRTPRSSRTRWLTGPERSSQRILCIPLFPVYSLYSFRALWPLRSQLFPNLFSHRARPIRRSNLEADSAHAGVPAAAVTLADGGQVVIHRLGRPGVGSHRDLGPKAGREQRHRVCGAGEQVIRNELVVPFHVISDQIEEYDAIAILRAFEIG